jgi:hypothetical protein
MTVFLKQPFFFVSTDIVFHYHINAKQDKQTDDTIEFLDQYNEYNRKIVDFSFEGKWVKRDPFTTIRQRMVGKGR